MGIVIGAKPEHSFTEPLGLLSDCHRRIERFLHALAIIVAQSQEIAMAVNQVQIYENEEGGVHYPPVSASLDEKQRQAMDVALRYFREAAPCHTRDEEESLFPRMRACKDARAQAAITALDSLESDHDTAETAHAEVEQLGRNWLAEGRITSNDLTRLSELLHNLQSLYQRHIHIEDTQIFPLAKQILDAADIHSIGVEMAERRGKSLSSMLKLTEIAATFRGKFQTPIVSESWTEHQS